MVFVSSLPMSGTVLPVGIPGCVPVHGLFVPRLGTSVQTTLQVVCGRHVSAPSPATFLELSHLSWHVPFHGD